VSVRQGLLVLLSEQDRHGYQLRQEFELRTGGTWPINVGQIYTTLNRLQRDGMVSEVGRQDDGSVIYSLTDAGRDEAQEWWQTPVDRSSPAREELAIKLALAVGSPAVEVADVVQRQRSESLRALLGYTSLKRRLPPAPQGADLARLLVLDSLIFAAEAEVRWLDHTERLLAAAKDSATTTDAGADSDRPDRPDRGDPS
jgi:DNA-binding PadR family transcriptional regulator